MMVVPQHKEVECRNQPVRIVPCNQIYLMIFECASQQTEIHDARRTREAQAVTCDEPFVAIRTLHEFVSEPGAPLRSKRRGLRERLQVQPSRIRAANHHGESVVETKRRPHGETELAFIAPLYVSIHFVLVAARCLFENCRQRGSGVFGVDIDSSRKDCLLANECSGQIEAAFDRKVSAGFDDLRKHFAEDDLLGEVFGSDNDAIGMACTTYDWKQ